MSRDEFLDWIPVIGFICFLIFSYSLFFIAITNG